MLMLMNSSLTQVTNSFSKTRNIKKLIDRKFAEPVEGGVVVTEEVAEKPAPKRKSKRLNLMMLMTSDGELG